MIDLFSTRYMICPFWKGCTREIPVSSIRGIDGPPVSTSTSLAERWSAEHLLTVSISTTRRRYINVELKESVVLHSILNICFEGNIPLHTVYAATIFQTVRRVEVPSTLGVLLVVG